MATADNYTTWVGIDSASERKAMGRFGKVACPLYLALSFERNNSCKRIYIMSPDYSPSGILYIILNKKAHMEIKEVTMAQTASKDYVKVPKLEYSLLKEVYRTVKRQAFLVRLDDAEKNLTAGKTKTVSVDDLIASV